jgi:putative DNA primase/helicase
LEQSLDGDQELIKFLQLWAGYCLTGLTTAHALLFIFGPGGNGKSVFLNTLINILGTYGAVAAMETFTASKSERHSTELAMLRGARLVTASETEEGRAWAEAKIKAMTGGDPITARFMRQDNFTFRPQFKLTIAGNHAPSLRSVDDAMRRRFNIAPFILKPANPDRFLEEKLRAEYPQILAWAIAGAREYLSSGLTRPAAVIAATNEYFSEQDVFGQWFQERCEERQGSWDTTAKFFSDWTAYAKAQGEEPGTQKSFGTQMSKRGYKSISRRDLGVVAKVYSGVKLIVQQEAESDDWR